MKKNRSIEAKFMGGRRGREMPVRELRREHGISRATYLGGRLNRASMMRQMKALEDDNQRLMRMFTDLSIYSSTFFGRLLVESDAASSASGVG